MILVIGNKFNNKIGFSLIEFLISILILSILLIPSITVFFRYHQNLALTSSANEIVSALQLARSYAINERSSCTVVFEENTFSIYRGGKLLDKKYNLPQHVKIKAKTPGFDPVVFLPDGTSSQAGSLILVEENSKKEKRIILYNLTGKCIIENGK